jgi:hypothetical protein
MIPSTQRLHAISTRINTRITTRINSNTNSQHLYPKTLYHCALASQATQEYTNTVEGDKEGLLASPWQLLYFIKLHESLLELKEQISVWPHVRPSTQVQLVYDIFLLDKTMRIQAH